jgi:hypothetical protein
MIRAAVGSAHDQPRSVLAIRPASSTADRYVHSRVWLESATAEAEPNSRPARRWAADSSGITTSDSAASAMPGRDCPASPVPGSARAYNPAHRALPVTPVAPERLCWSPQQAAAFLRHNHEHYADQYTDLFELLLGTGLRRGEALGLHWSD